MNKATFNVTCAVLGLISLGFVGLIVGPKLTAKTQEWACQSAKSRVLEEGEYFKKQKAALELAPIAALQAIIGGNTAPLRQLVAKADDVINRAKDEIVTIRKLREWCIPAELADPLMDALTEAINTGPQMHAATDVLLAR